MKRLLRWFSRGHGPPILAGLLGSLLIVWFQFTTEPVVVELRNRLEYIVYDLRISLFPVPRPEVGHRIVIVDIDEKSLEAEGRWPWSRAKVARMVTRLAEAGVVVIAFDVVFSEPERNVAVELRESLAGTDVMDPGFVERLEAVAPAVDFDRRLAEHLQETDVVLAYFLHNEQATQVGELPAPVLDLTPEQAARIQVPKMSGYTASLPILQGQALGGGFVSTDPDLDGVIRRSPLVLRYGDALYPSLSLATAQAYLFADDVNVEMVPVGDTLAITSVRLTQETTYTDGKGRVIVPYRGGRGTFDYVSATDVLSGTVGADELEATIVLVGTSAIGLADLRATPVEKNFPGVEVHANILDGLLSKDIPVRPDWERGATLVLMASVGVAMSLILPFLGPGWLTVTGLSVLAGIVAANLHFWQQRLLDLPLSGHVLLVLLLTATNLVIGFLRENTQRRMLKSMFDQYVPPAHIDAMMDEEGSASTFSGDSRNMTVLFSDIRSFTTISEHLSATELKEMLNLYFTPITQTIFDHKGTIDKYVGDMVMAFWGAPLEDSDHATNAVAAGFSMLKITEELKPELEARGLPEIRVGIGINTGTMNVGDMGSTFRRAYTVLGDAVNLGSRLEGVTKFYGVRMLVGEETRKEAGDQFIFRLVDRIQVKGKDEAIAVYEPLGRKGEISLDVQAELDSWHRALEHYVGQRWNRAEDLVRELASSAPDVKLYEIYLERIASLREQDLPEDWDGTFRHLSK